MNVMIEQSSKLHKYKKQKGAPVNPLQKLFCQNSSDLPVEIATCEKET